MIDNQKVYATKRFTFEACHHLQNHRGKCANVHGHSYKLEVTLSTVGNFLSGSSDPYSRMVLDFSVIKGIVSAEVVNKYDHKDLNEFFETPTAECMVVRIFEDIVSVVSSMYSQVKVEEVKLWETEDSYASFRGEYV